MIAKTVTRVLAALIPTLLSFSPAAHAGQAYCVRVTSEHNADTTDLKRFRDFHGWRDKTGNDLAIAIWQYLCDYETGLYHFYEVHDGPDPFPEYSTMREPLKMLNVYNCGYCGIFGPTVEGIYAGCGFDVGRSFGLPGWSHCATEIFYGGSWHYFDVDVRGALMRPDGVIASLREAQTSKQLWVDSIGRVKPFFPHHATPQEAAKVGDIYANSTADYQYRWYQGSHTADWSLRRGESFTRYWQPQEGRWNHRAEYNREKWVRDLLLTAPVGMKPNHREFTRWNHGEGLFHYAPDLTSASSDFADGAYTSEGATPQGDGLRLAGGTGQVVFRIFTPFVIVPKVDDLMNLDDDSEASVVRIDRAGPLRVRISLDNGLSWIDVASLERGAHKLDLTRWVKGAYGYLLRLDAGANDVVVRALAVDTWVQVAPISLPRLKKGTNHLRYDCGDRYDEITEPVLVLPNLGDAEDLKRYVAEMPNDYDPKRHAARIRGDVVVKLQAPPGTKIAWFSIGGTFNTNQGQSARSTDNRIAYAVGEPARFTEIYKADVPAWTAHWRYNYDTDVRLPQPAEAVYAKFTGRPAVNVIRACLHVQAAVATDPVVRITHGYRIGQNLIQKSIDMPRPGEYTIDCDEDVENVFVRIEKRSKASNPRAIP